MNEIEQVLLDRLLSFQQEADRCAGVDADGYDQAQMNVCRILALLSLVREALGPPAPTHERTT